MPHPSHRALRAPTWSTSRICSTYLAVCTPTRSTPLCQPSSAESRPPAALWLTRLCWQRKKSGKPRPIKMGELLRSPYAEHLVNQFQVALLRSTASRMHQWCAAKLHVTEAGGERLLANAGGNRPGSCQPVWHRRVAAHPSGSGCALPQWPRSRMAAPV